MRPIKTILYPTDQSERSQSAFCVASALARDCGARLVILEVVPPPVTIYGPSSEEYLEQLEKALDQLQVDDPKVRVERRVAEGNPVAEILRVAEETNCDLILMASHGRTGAKRVLMGSIAELVVRRARCPVLVIKSPGIPGPAERPLPIGAGSSLEAQNT